MSDLLRKEMKLSASLLSYLFIAFALMFFLPGYPVLCGAFFVTLGIFQSFLNAREANDIVFSALLPIAKKDVVRGKYVFCCFIELCAAAIMGCIAVLRMTLLSELAAYRQNPLMNANLFALCLAFVIFGLFNAVFVGGFFKTVYRMAKPFVYYIISCFAVIAAGEAAHHFPGLEPLNSFGTDNFWLQLATLFVGVMLYTVMTLVSCRIACRRFELIDL